MSNQPPHPLSVDKVHIFCLSIKYSTYYFTTHHLYKCSLTDASVAAASMYRQWEAEEVPQKVPCIIENER